MKLETVDLKIKLFGTDGVNGIYGGSEHGHLIGKTLDHSCARIVSDIKILEQKKYFSNVYQDTRKSPSSIQLSIPEDSLNISSILTVTINDTIAAILPSGSITDEMDQIDIMIDNRALKTGNNLVKIYALETSKNCYH